MFPGRALSTRDGRQVPADPLRCRCLSTSNGAGFQPLAIYACNSRGSAPGRYESGLRPSEPDPDQRIARRKRVFMAARGEAPGLMEQIVPGAEGPLQRLAI